nr:MAG TPA: hypothetical protein [Bacteriophage sp.]
MLYSPTLRGVGTIFVSIDILHKDLSVGEEIFVH